jgi:hypothetical protein
MPTIDPNSTSIFTEPIPMPESSDNYIRAENTSEKTFIKEENIMPCDCPACRRDNILNGTLTGECNCCHTKLDAHSSFQIMGDKSLVCDKCAKEHYITCVCCNKLYNKNESKEVNRISEKNDLNITNVCLRCFTVNYRECSCCHKFFNRQDFLTYKENIYCKICFDKSFKICPMCNNTFQKDKITHKIRGKYSVCDKCFNYYGPITTYEEKPKIEFQGKPPHYYGIELEVEVQNKSKEERGVKAQKVIDLFGDFAIVKEDGSLSCGFEICTQPASKEEHLVRWNKFFDNLPDNLVSFNSERGNCGLHIHCSKKPLSLLTIAKIVVFVNDENNQPHIETIAGRRSCNYSCICKKKYGTVKRIGTLSRSDRYEAVNLVNHDTIEFRIFKGTLKRESFFKAIEFCDALIQFCMVGNYGITYCRNWDNFVNYVKLRNKDYPHLYAFICARFSGKETKFTEQEMKLIKKFGFDVEAGAEPTQR